MNAVLERPTRERTGGPVLGWRALLCLAARDARRRTGRTALVVLLLAVPVALLAVWTVALRTTELDERQKGLLRLGDTADAVVSASLVAYGPGTSGGPSSDGDVTVIDPPLGGRTASVQDVTYGRVQFAGRFRSASIESGDLTDPLLRGAVDVRDGRAPAGPGEAAVSIETARRYGVAVGDTVVVRRGMVVLTVVGTYEWAIDVNRIAVLTAAPLPGTEEPGAGTTWVDAPDGTSTTAIRNALAETFRSSAVVRGEPTPSFDAAISTRVVLFTMATIGMFVVGIVISAAFAVSARRQLRMLGVIGSNGGSPSQLRALMTTQGVVTGLVGVVVAAVLATAGVAALAPHLNRLSGYRLPGLRLSPLDVVLCAALTVATAAVAAYLPARSAARVPTLAALGGRRPLRPVSVSVPVLGLVCFGLGLIVIAVSVGARASDSESWLRLSGAGFLLLLGAVLVMPWLIGRLEPLAGRLRGPSRLAARSMARHRSRTGPIAAAILAAAGGAMALATFDAAYYPVDDSNGLGPDVVQIGTSNEDGVNDSSVSDAVVGRVTAIVGPSAVARWSFVRIDDRGADAVRIDGRQASLLTTDRATLRASGLPAEVVAAFDAGRVLLYDAGGATDGERLIEQIEVDPRTGLERSATPLPIDPEPMPYVTLLRVVLGEPCTAATGCDPSVSSPALIVPADRLDALGWEAQPGFVQVTAASGAIGDDERRDLRRLHAGLQDEADETEASGGDVVRTYLNFDGQFVRGIDWVPFILGGLVLLAVVGVTLVGLALSASEGRADDDTLVSLGAPPRLRRRVRAYEALGTAGIACVLAVPLGFVPAAIAIRAERREFDSLRRIGIPWTMIVIIVIGVPVLGAIVAYATGRNHRSLLVRND